MTVDWRDVQRIVLHGGSWKFAQHLVLCFDGDARPLRFLHGLQHRGWPSAADPTERKNGRRDLEVQCSLGFSRRGLELARLPKHVLACFALKSPAFWTGAALRAHRHLGLSGSNGPAKWDDKFDSERLHAVLSLHAKDEASLKKAVRRVRLLARFTKVQVHCLEPAGSLPVPPGEEDQDAQWVHFGYRDGLSRIGIEEWPPHGNLDAFNRASRHRAGEFLLGHPQDSGANPWIAGPGLRVWPKELRDFFHNGCFGVLVRVQQYVDAFEDFVERSARTAMQFAPDLFDALPDGATPEIRIAHARAEIKGKLCGRYPNGRLLVAPDATPKNDFDYDHDEQGRRCPFGAHIRRMNPRGEAVPHAAPARPLLRRGMPYGPAWCGKDDGIERGLLGQFFCASIEDQFEHLVGQWGDRVPIGSKDRGGARDPLMGAHESGDGPFEIPREDKPPLLLKGLQAFTRTRGVAYLFYPSRRVLTGMTLEPPWFALPEDGP